MDEVEHRKSPGLLSTSEVFSQFDIREVWTTQESEKRSPNAVTLWREAIALMSALYYPEATYNYRVPGDTFQSAAETFGFQYRVNIGGAVTRTSKVSLDLCLSGYYHQSLALSRLVYESYRRMLFVRRWPHTVFRFYPESMIPEDIPHLPGYKRKAKGQVDGDEWSAFEDWLQTQNDAATDRELLWRARAQMVDLHTHAHPDLEGTADLMDIIDGALDPTFSDLMPKPFDDQLLTSLRVGMNGVTFILYEMSRWGKQVDQWGDRYLNWLDKWTKEVRRSEL